MKMRHIVRYSILAVSVGACIATAPAHAQRRGIEGSFDRGLNVSGPVDLEVGTGSGRIEVRQGPQGRVDIHGVIRAGTDRWWRSDRDAEDIVRQLESNPPIEQSGNSIHI